MDISGRGQYQTADGGLAVITERDRRGYPDHPYGGYWISSGKGTVARARWDEAGNCASGTDRNIVDSTSDLPHTLEQERERLSWALGALDKLRSHARETYELWDKDQNHKVGKRPRAMAGELPGYSAELDAIHASR